MFDFKSISSSSSIDTILSPRDIFSALPTKNKKSHILWSRKSSKDIKEIFNVYGHTIFEEPKINEYRCGIDLGCCYKDNTSKIPNPRICALEFPSMKLFIQENIED